MFKTGLKTKIKSFLAKRQEAKIKDYGFLEPKIWDLETKGSNLTIENFVFTELAENYGTPLFIVNAEKTRKNAQEFLSGFKKNCKDFEAFFSYKTNPVPGMLRIFHEEGFGAEVTSEYELWLALKLGVKPEKIIFDGRAKSIESLKTAVEKQIRLINIDSFEEIEKLKELTQNQKIDVGIRLQTAKSWKGQFGFTLVEAVLALKKIKETKNLNFAGFHFHLGTSIKEFKKYLQNLEDIFAFASEIRASLGLETKILDIGGGFGVPQVRQFTTDEQEISERFGIPFLPPENTKNPTCEDFAKIIGKKISELSTKTKIFPKILAEPGRIVSSSAQFLLLKVVETKQRKQKIAILDGGINIAAPLRGEFREAFVANKMDFGQREIYKIVGPTCNPGDVLYAAKFFPKLEVGDVLVVVDAGAYFVSYANSFCFPKPAIVVVENGKNYLSRKKETFDYLNLNDFE
ncbi:alanine racemase [bacterium]|nr:alanine racemase [bacterium]